jgi:hypothetical protein
MGGKSTNVVPLLPTGISRLGRKIKVLVEISFSRLVLFASRPPSWRLLRGHRLSDGRPSANLNHAGLQPLRQIAIELDKQHPVLYVSATYFDMTGELKATLESARCDAPVEESALHIRSFLLTSDRECVSHLPRS